MAHARTICAFTVVALVASMASAGEDELRRAWRDSLKTLDSPDASSVFRFKKGERVVTKRGRGSIRQGYDSGEVTGYEIDGDDGTLFIAEESEVSAIP